MRFGASDGVADRATLDLEMLAAPDTRVDSIERQGIRGSVGTVHLWPGPAQNSPRPPDLAADKCFDPRALDGICSLVDQDDRLAVALMDCARPVDEDREVQPVEPDVAERAFLDVPAPAAFAFAGGRGRIEVARAAPIAVARDENFSVQV